MKKRCFKTMLSVILAIAMVITAVPANLTLTVQAAEAGVEEPQSVEPATVGLENPGTGSPEVPDEDPEGDESNKDTTVANPGNEVTTPEETTTPDPKKETSDDDSQKKEDTGKPTPSEKDQNVNTVMSGNEYAGPTIEYSPDASDPGAVTFYYYSTEKLEADDEAKTGGVRLKGSWNGWSEAEADLPEMTLDEQASDEDSNKYVYKVTLATEDTGKENAIEYGILAPYVDGKNTWNSDAENPNTGGNCRVNRNPVKDSDGNITLYYYPSHGAYPSAVKVKYKKTGESSYQEVAMDKDDKCTAVYSVTLSGLEDADYEYCFEVDGTEIQDTNNVDTGKFSKVTYPDEDPTVKSPVVGPGQVTFNYYNPTAKSVAAAGTWNSYSTTADPMTCNKDTGYWTLTKKLAVGTYEYKFVVDGGWFQDPLNKPEGGDQANCTFTITEAGVVSPKIEGTTVTFFFEINDENADMEALYVVGGMNGWQNSIGTDNEWKMTKNEESGYWEFTKEEAPAGHWEYKYHDGNSFWSPDPLNPAKTEGGDPNSIFNIKGLGNAETEIVRSGVTTLTKTLAWYQEDVEDTTGTATEVTYALSAETPAAYKNKITLAKGEDGAQTIQLAEDFPEDVETFTLTATATVEEKEYTSTVTVKIVDKKYKYNIYYYDEEHVNFEGHTPDKDDAALWIYSPDVDGVEKPFVDTEEINGNTWLKAEVEVSLTEVQIIPKSKGTWAWEDESRRYRNTKEDEETNLYIIFGDAHNIYTEVPKTVNIPKRHLVVDYERTSNTYPIHDDANSQGWKLYTWNSGYGSNVYAAFEKATDKTGSAQVKIKRGLESLSFCMAYVPDDLTGANHDEKKWIVKDGGDHRVDVPENQNVVKVKMVEDQGVVKVYPYNIGYKIDPAEKTIHFYYRDDDEFLNGSTSSHTVALEVGTLKDDGTLDIISGTTMTFNSETQRWEYDLVSTDEMSAVTYYYRYKVDSDYVTDSFNTADTADINGTEYSVCTYEKPELEVSATMQNASMDYNENNVLTISFNVKEGSGTGEGGDVSGNDVSGNDVAEQAEEAEEGSEEGIEETAPVEISKATVDLTAVGGKLTDIDPELLQISIAVTQNTELGEKKLPVVVYDEYGNKYETEATVNVVARNKGNDFDWDEAVIYFAVTDRFFDGNAGNNGKGYNVGEYGSSSYHGGDFAGLTQKLDYLDDLGVNTIWITPIVEQQTTANTDDKVGESWGYHGYWAKDFEKLDSHLGTEAEFKALLDAAHARGMKIMVDVVLNHAGYGKDIKNYFNTNFTDENGEPIRMIREEEEMVGGNDQKSSLSGLQDFLTENKEVRDLLVEWQSNWISKYDIDYYRVDTVKHVDNTTWSAFKNALTEINPDFKMIGEWAGAGYSTNTGTLGEGRMDSLLDFDFNNRATDFVKGKISDTEAFMSARNTAIDNATTLGAFLGSHDEDGFVYALTAGGMDDTQAQNLALVAASLQLTAKGQVVIYYGEEIGMTGANNYPWQTNRYDFDWSELDNNNATLAHYKAMLEIRNRYSEVLAKGTRSTISANDASGLDVFSRSYNGTTLTVALNISDAAQTYTLTGLDAGTVLYDYYATYKNGVRKQYTADASGNMMITVPAAADGGTVVLTAGTPEYASGNVQEGFDVKPIADKAFTGKNITLSAEELVVYYNGKPLEIKKDYTASYKNNKNPGTATITIKGKGNYAGTVTTEFQIVRKNINDADIVVDYKDLVHTGKAQKALTKITNNGVKLGAKDYTVKYYLLYANGSRAGSALTSVTADGNYEMIITGAGNYTGTRKETFRVVKGGTYMNKTKITLTQSNGDAIPKKGIPYTGDEITLKVEVKNKNDVVAADCYKVEYSNNTEVGTATVTIKGIPAKGYCGEVVKTFKIAGVALSSVAELDTTKWETNVTYDYAAGKAVQPNEIITEENTGLLKLKASAPAGSALTYEVAYTKNDKPGTATVTFTGTGMYTGTIKKTFKVDAIDITSLTTDNTNEDGSYYTVAETAPYMKKGAMAAVTVNYLNNVLVENRDYKLKYKNNKNVVDTATATVEITGMGVFKGKVTGNFKIEKVDLSDIPAGISLTAPDVVYSTKAGKYMSAPVLDGAKLKASDFTIKYSVMESGEWTEKDNKAVVPAGTTVKVDVTPKSTGALKNYTGTGSVTYRVTQASIAKAKVSVKAQEYTGKAVTLGKTDFSSVQVGKDKLVLGRDFEIVAGSYTNNINKGNASVTIRGIGNYSGEKKVTFKITSRFMKWWWNLFA